MEQISLAGHTHPQEAVSNLRRARMAFRRKSSGPGPNPGLTPIDDIHGGGEMQDHEPNTTTGRLPVQDKDSSTSPGIRRRDKREKKKA
jgi:hypothetical protein